MRLRTAGLAAQTGFKFNDGQVRSGQFGRRVVNGIERSSPRGRRSGIGSIGTPTSDCGEADIGLNAVCFGKEGFPASGGGKVAELQYGSQCTRGGSSEGPYAEGDRYNTNAIAASVDGIRRRPKFIDGHICAL